MEDLKFCEECWNEAAKCLETFTPHDKYYELRRNCEHLDKEEEL
jgi:hypothetical protein